jgi:hypothetical protein
MYETYGTLILLNLPQLAEQLGTSALPNAPVRPDRRHARRAARPGAPRRAAASAMIALAGLLDPGTRARS